MNKRSFGLAGQTREELIKRFLGRKSGQTGSVPSLSGQTAIPEAFQRFDRFPGYEKLLVPQAAAKRLGLANPFFKVTRRRGRCDDADRWPRFH